MKTINFSSKNQITIDDIRFISQKKASVKISDDADFVALIEKGYHYLADCLDQEGFIYGVTTGYGDNCTRPVSLKFVHELPNCLIRFHGCGLGEFLSPEQTRAALAVRLAALCRGFSGISMNLLKMFETLINQDILPLIPSEGSVGASGDLTPLSYIAAVISGKRRVWYKGEICDTKDVFNECGIKPHVLLPKEGLAIMNGTSIMTALATEAFNRAEYLVLLASRLTSLTSLALRGNPKHYDPILFTAKPHPGQAKVASYIHKDLSKAPCEFPIDRLQDRYSTRCAPHVIGVLADMLPTFKTVIETEINSACDNPLLDMTEDGRVLSGGHFYGGHIAFVMDSMKTLVANIADLLDRQLATLVDPKMNHGLPANLSGVVGEREVLNHALKAVHIAASAFTAEALKNTMPASVFSRSTESHNQDKVSMGTIAARDALRVLQLTEQVVAAHMIATIQAIRLREKESLLSNANYPKDLHAYMTKTKALVPFIEEDIELDVLLRNLLDKIQACTWALYVD